MAFTEWESYVPFLDALAVQRERWSRALDFSNFDSSIRLACPELVGGEQSPVGNFGYETLLSGLRDEFTSSDEDVFQQIRLAALAEPAVEAGLGAEWQGYFISTLPDDTEVYADSRFAEPSKWTELEVSSQALSLTYDAETGLMYDAEDWYLKDGETKVWPDEDNPSAFKDKDGNVYVNGELQAQGPQDLREQHFDPETSRWRRWSDEAEGFEYYHNDDGVWERTKDGQWYRKHSNQYGWLAYDEPSVTWLDTTSKPVEWRAFEAVGQARIVTPPQAGPLQAEPEAATLGEPEPAAEALVAEVAAIRDELQDQALEAAKAAGLVPQLVSEEDWEDYIDGRVLQQLQGAA
ncbi:MAG TPA: hypothetical protein VFQ44_03870 [Streptosporangiaceae bacterium]|nr:hypothetical protein [Streptosporangiaceae bacterium]